MSREIKTRENYKDIKVLDKSIHGMKRMRQASIRAKESNPQEQISKGATTIWEHWDGLMESGDFWCDEMNSFNHYAYGAVADWVFEKALGIQVVEEYPGFAKVRIAPKVDERLGWLEGSFHTRHGKVHVKWIVKGDDVRYEIDTDMPAIILIGDREYQKEAGKNIFWSSYKGGECENI